MGVDEKTVEKIAGLAKLTFTDKEKEKYTVQLGQILEYMKKLNDVDTENIKPLSHVQEVTNVFREDKNFPSLKKEDALKNAPEVKSSYFCVPKVISDGPTPGKVTTK